MDEAVLGGTHRGERRHLTVVFCDLVESTALSELLDPEETSELVLAYQEMGHAAVTELGGYVAQYLGDGLLIYFGYPTAHEDDAERAVRAGLAIVAGLRGMSAQMRPTAGVHLAARVGIHTGPTIVGAMGNADRSDISVFGSTPNIAARLESHAQPGTVLISNTTRRLLHTRFRLADRGRPALKGVRQDIHVWEVAGVDVVTPRAQVQPAVPLVGRQEELALICACLDDADAGMGRTVLMTGEPGVGKSRLLQAVYQRVVGTDHVWLEFQCSRNRSDDRGACDVRTGVPRRADVQPGRREVAAGGRRHARVSRPVDASATTRWDRGGLGHGEDRPSVPQGSVDRHRGDPIRTQARIRARRVPRPRAVPSDRVQPRRSSPR